MDDFQMQQRQVQQQQIQQQQVDQQQQLRTHLVGLQNWDQKENQTIEQRRMEHNQYLMDQELQRNAEMRAAWIERSGQIEAKRAADGRPAQIQRPAPKTYKKRREDKRLDKKAKKMTPLADHISLHMLESLQKEQSSHANSMTPEITAEATRQDVDIRVLRNFAQGYETNKHGEPLDETQEKRMEEDKQFLEDYISKDAKRRKPHLDRMTEQVLSIDITDEMLEPEYMEYHAGELHEQISRLVYFENVYKDEKNKDYFSDLPQITRDLIQCKVIDRYALYGPAFTHLCALRGVRSDGARMDLADQAKAEKDRNIYEPIVAMEKEMLRTELAKSRQRERTLLQNEYQRLYDIEKEKLLEIGDQMKRAVEEDKMKTDKGADMTNLNLTAYVTGYSFGTLAEYRKMIEDHPEEYKKNQQLVDTLYQQMYRAVDAMGDLTLEAAAAQGVHDEMNQTKEQSKFKSAMKRKASNQMEENEAKTNLVREQLSSIADALQGILKNKPMNDAGRQIIRQFGF